MQVMFRQIQRDPTAMIGQGLAELRGKSPKESTGIS
jgi:hypothetical protein